MSKLIDRIAEVILIVGAVAVPIAIVLLFLMWVIVWPTIGMLWTIGWLS